MHFRGIGTAHPPARYTKAECLAAFQRSDWFGRLDARSHFIARTVLQRDNGIEARRLALDSLDDVFTIDPDTLDRRFLTHAPPLASEAATRALVDAGLAPDAIDAIVVSTCTGYLCPGLSGYVAERLGLRADIQAYDLVGQGCAAALPNLQLGRALLASGAAEHVLSVCVEVSSAAM
jgi:alkylresorcinol/alkylpyrone synthase